MNMTFLYYVGGALAILALSIAASARLGFCVGTIVRIARLVGGLS